MEEISEYRLRDLSLIDSGSFATTLKYTDPRTNHVYCYKKFEDTDDLKVILTKIKLLANMNETLGVVLPKILVKRDGQYAGYLTDYIAGKDFVFTFDMPEAYRLICLKEIKKVILKMHRLGIIHRDIHDGNILFNDNLHIIDFDLCDIRNVYHEKYLINSLSCVYNEHNPLDEGLDVFMMNILTYQTMYNFKYECVDDIMEAIEKEGYGIFNSSDGKKIIKNILSLKKTNQYLIDSIDIKRFIN